MAKYRVWYSTESLCNYIIDKTILKDRDCDKKPLYVSDAANPSEFFTIPDHIKKILYLDSPDIIVECDQEPLFSIEVSTEAGTGHNVFQRFARLAASVENDVPAIYIYPEAVLIERENRGKRSIKWDKINPLIFRAMDDMMDIYNIPALLYYFPSYYQELKDKEIDKGHTKNKGLKFESNFKYAACPESNDDQMTGLFSILGLIISSYEKTGINSRQKLLSKKEISNHRHWMQNQGLLLTNLKGCSPLSSTIEVPTRYVLNYLARYEDDNYKLGELLKSREKSLLYCIDAKFRGDPYPGALCALDYIKCREGKTFEERKMNLILCWGKVSLNEEKECISVDSNKDNCSINSFVSEVQKCNNRNLLVKGFSELKNYEIPRYYMQVRYGSMFSKSKHIRVYSYFSDAIIFKDGALWRDS